MRKFVKFVVVATLLLFVGIPLACVALIAGLAALGIAIGIGGAVVGLLLAMVKFALMIAIPLFILWWVVTRLGARERTY